MLFRSLTFDEHPFADLPQFTLRITVPRHIAYRARLPGPFEPCVAVTVKYPLAATGVASDSAEHHLMTDTRMEDVIWEGIRDVLLQFNNGASREGVPSLPADEN